jgi:small subunit ribosomal protein S6
MALYESVLIARQDISAGQVDTLADEMEKIITDNGGSVARREYWGLRSLTYRMKKNRKGHYVMFNLDAPSDAVQEMERNLRLHEDVLRYMTIRLDELRADPSPMAHGKTDRDRADRGERSEAKETPVAEETTDAKETPVAEAAVETAAEEAPAEEVTVEAAPEAEAPAAEEEETKE